MKEISINEKISYIESSENPLSADIGLIRENGGTWLYDVGNDEGKAAGLNGSYNVVISHFHQDHTGNIGRLNIRELFVSKESYRRISMGTIVTEDICFGNIRIFPIPSSHCRGCLGMEVDETYAFVGDALYCKSKNGSYVYNAQILKDEIAVLKKIKAAYLLVSHFKGLVRNKEEVIAELEAIYKMRNPDNPEIMLK